MKNQWAKLWFFLREANLAGKINVLAYLFEMAFYRLFKKRLRNEFAVTVKGIKFLVKTHNMDLSIIYEIVGKRVYDNGPRFTLDSRSDSVFMDVGANIGCVSLLWAKEYPKATIYAFEPHPGTYQRLISNIQHNQARSVQAFPYAVSRAPGEISLSFADNTGMSFSGEQYQIKNLKDVSEFTVKAVSLDEFCHQQSVRSVDLLKIDVEGHEGEVLRGAANTLRNVSHAVVEYHSQNLKTECLNIFRDAGFSVETPETSNLIFAWKVSPDRVR